jgi:AcrR family transcriptional regulator
MSHEVQTDLRIRRTHLFLQEAMIELITEKGFEAITVGDIAERAMINRATFYRHYQDKYDLVARIFEESADSLVEHMKPFHKGVMTFFRAIFGAKAPLSKKRPECFPLSKTATHHEASLPADPVMSFVLEDCVC